MKRYKVILGKGNYAMIEVKSDNTISFASDSLVDDDGDSWEGLSFNFVKESYKSIRFKLI